MSLRTRIQSLERALAKSAPVGRVLTIREIIVAGGEEVMGEQPGTSHPPPPDSPPVAAGPVRVILLGGVSTADWLGERAKVRARDSGT